MENNQESFSESSSAAVFEKAAFITLIVTVVLGFLAFAPSNLLSLAALKTTLIGLGTLVSVIFFVLAKIKSKSATVSLHPLVWIAGATALAILLSSLLSPSVASSFFGKDFAADTGAFLLVLFISGALSFALTKGRESRSFLIFLTILGSFSLLALYHILRFFLGVNFLSFGIFTDMVYTTVGSWHDLGVFAGLSLIISLVSLQLLPAVNKSIRIFFIVAFAISSVLLVVIDLQSVWIIVAVTALAFGVYKYLLNRREAAAAAANGSPEGMAPRKWTSGLPVFALIVTVIAAFLAWSPGVIGTFVSSQVVARAGASYSEVDLPWGLTMKVAEPTIKSSPIFGAGPDRFVNQYLKYKPEVVNATPFWSSDFANGEGFILTSLVTEGLLGFILWIALILAFIWFGARALLGKDALQASPFARYGTAASYFGAGLLWISLINYMPQHAILLALFVLSGVFAAHVIPKQGNVSFSDGPMKIPMTVFLWILVAIAAVSIVFYVKAAIAEAYFESALNSLNSGGSLSVSAKEIQTALKLNPSDVYYQAIAEMDTYAVNQIISNATSTPSQSTIQLISGLINDGINSSILAERFDRTNPYNYLSEASVAVTAAGIGIQGAYATATSSYQEALNLDPFDPSIYLAEAKLEFFEQNVTGAENDINVALELKPDYADALFEAGVISYTEKDYATAVKAFTQVQEVQSDYQNIQNDINLAEAAASGSSQSSVSTTPPDLTSTTSPKLIKGK